jgi:peptidylprolyl isomerase
MNKNLIWIIIPVLLIVGALAYFNQGIVTNSFKSITSMTTTTMKKTLTNGLTVEDLKKGEGAEIQSGQTATFHYTGTLEDGKKFDSSLDRGVPFATKIGVGQVIKGWDIGIAGSKEESLDAMKVGGKRKLTIPYSLAYGEAGIPGTIPEKATLIFEVELLGVNGEVEMKNVEMKK